MQEIFNNIESQVQHNAKQGNSPSDRHWSAEVGVLLTVEDATALVDRIKELEAIAEEVQWWDTCPDEMKDKINSLLGS